MKPALPLFLTAALAGCSVPIVAPQPQQPVAARFSSATPASTATGNATANTGLDMGWWSRIGDAQLTELLLLAQANSPDLRTAAANVMSARARARESGADQYPAVTGQASATRSRTEGMAATDSTSALVDATWEIDLFAKAANTARASRLRSRASEADYAGAYVTLSAEVADTYMDYRACKLAEGVYREALNSQRQTLTATGDLVDLGLSPASEQALARANVASAEISLESQRTDCALVAQSMATLVGAPQDRIRAILAKGGGLPAAKPFRVTSVPSDMLRQRSDVLSAELEFAASLKDLRVAQSELYPSLTLGGTVTASTPQSWSFGPALSLPIFNAGAAKANVRKVNADAIAAGETYRATVLSAVEEVENALTRLNGASRSLGSAQVLVSQYQRYFAAVDEDWKAGGTTLLDREDARRQLQSAQLTRIDQRETLLRQWIALYKAVGGGWQRPAGDAADTVAPQTAQATTLQKKDS